MPIDDKTSIQSHEEASYKYLGVDENDGIQHSAMKVKLANEYYRRVRLILRSEKQIIDDKCFGSSSAHV